MKADGLMIARREVGIKSTAVEPKASEMGLTAATGWSTPIRLVTVSDAQRFGGAIEHFRTWRMARPLADPEHNSKS